MNKVAAHNPMSNGSDHKEKPTSPNFPVGKRVVQVISAITWVHLVVGIFLLSAIHVMFGGLSAIPDTNDFDLISRALLFAVHKPEIFYWPVLLSDIVALYILACWRASKRSRVTLPYIGLVLAIVACYAGVAGVAWVIGVFRSSSGTYVIFVIEKAERVILSGGILAIPAILIAFASIVGYRRSGSGVAICMTCGYDLAGLASQKPLRCPECGNVHMPRSDGADEPKSN
jgi:predicted RNA-binding Zn-ribbon protein involved in translation (DUF1610 family)